MRSLSPSALGDDRERVGMTIRLSVVAFGPAPPFCKVGTSADRLRPRLRRRLGQLSIDSLGSGVFFRGIFCGMSLTRRGPARGGPGQAPW